MHRGTTFVALHLVLVAAAACTLPEPAAPVRGATPVRGARPTAEHDRAAIKAVASAQAKAQAAPESPQAACRYAQALYLAYESGAVDRGAVAGARLLPGAVARLDAAASASPQQAWAVYADKGLLLLRAGRAEQGLRALEASMAATPNIAALGLLVREYSVAEKYDLIDKHCKVTFAAATNMAGQYAVMKLCARARPGAHPAEALPWVNADDLTLYRQQIAIEQAEAEAERQAWNGHGEGKRSGPQAMSSQPAASSLRVGEGGDLARVGPKPTGSAAASAPATTPQVKVTLVNSCRRLVRLLRRPLGEGQGTRYQLPVDAVLSQTVNVGDRIWLLSEADTPIASVTVPEGEGHIEVLESCAELVLD